MLNRDPNKRAPIRKLKELMENNFSSKRVSNETHPDCKVNFFVAFLFILSLS